MKAKDEVLIKQIKIGITEYVRLLKKEGTVRVMSEYIRKKINKNYNYLSKIFSQPEGETIE